MTRILHHPAAPPPALGCEEDPGPDGTPGSGHPLPEEKRLEVVSAKLGEAERRFVDMEAQAQGITRSTLLQNMIRQRHGLLLAGTGKRGGPGPLVGQCYALLEAAQRAEADGRVSAGERAEITGEIAALMGRLYPKRRAA